METAEFLSRILPSTGLYVIARLTSKGFRHQVCDTVEEAAVYAMQFDAQGVPTYHACAAFREREVETRKPDGSVWKQVRTHKNVRALRSFFMDLDVEPGNPKKFESQEAAIGGLVAFCSATGLPIPMVVSSGSGIHIYWTLKDEILPEAWKPVAEGLKLLSAGLEFKADPAVTADVARVLRPVGTFNRKDQQNVRQVELVGGNHDIPLGEFRGLVHTALVGSKFGKVADPVRQVEAATETINQAFAIQREFPPCSGEKVATRCAQLAKMRDTRGCISEPHWYACIQLLCHSIEGDALIHQWSNGYDGYTKGETATKIGQIRGQGLGPSLCATFDSRNPAGGCDTCPFRGKISSPAQLGTIVPSAPPPTVEIQISEEKTLTVTVPNPPLPFQRVEGGGIVVEEDGITHKIYEYDCFPTELAYDEQLGYETMRIRHFLPQEGWKEFVVRSSLLADPKQFEIALRDQHMQPLIRNKLAMYYDSYIRDIRAKMKLRKLFRCQGWKNNDTEFVLADKLYRPGEVVQAGFSHGATGFCQHFGQRGALGPWRDLTWVFNDPAFAPHAFLLLCAFAAPLLTISGGSDREGFTVCALGPTGIGKSTMGRMLAAVYGHPTSTWAKRKDSENARYERLGAYSALPVYMDEITTIESKELRDLVYSVATGKGRDTLTQRRELREGAEWRTILVTSTNDSLQARMQLAKQNAEAEAMRLFEFKFPDVPRFGPVAEMVPNVVSENYGVAGAKYIEHLVNNLPRVRAESLATIHEVKRSFDMRNQERFWIWAVALALYGGRLAREAGVIDFDPDVIRPWLLKETSGMRKNVAESRVSAIAVLSQYLNEHIGERLVVTEVNAGMGALHARPSRGVLSQRYEKDKHLIWFPIRHWLQWCAEKHFNAAEIRDELGSRGILLADGAACSLGKGTDFASGAVKCWKIKADHPELNLMAEEMV